MLIFQDCHFFMIEKEGKITSVNMGSSSPSFLEQFLFCLIFENMHDGNTASRHFHQIQNSISLP